MEDLVKGGLGQLHAHQQDQSGHDQAGYVLDAAVAEGMVGVGLLPCQAEAQQRHRRGPGVGQVVEGVRRNGDGAGQPPGEEFADEQQDVQGDAHSAAQGAVGPADGGRGDVVPVRNEPAAQQS